MHGGWLGVLKLLCCQMLASQLILILQVEDSIILCCVAHDDACSRTQNKVIPRPFSFTVFPLTVLLSPATNTIP